MKIIFDYNRTLYNPDLASLYPGVVELLQELAKKHELFLISKNEPGRRDKVVELGIKEYFSDITFVDQKTLALFKTLVQNGENALVIGDRVRGEIRLGNELGCITIWIQQGKFAGELPATPSEQPNYTVKNIDELHTIISKYE